MSFFFTIVLLIVLFPALAFVGWLFFLFALALITTIIEHRNQVRRQAQRQKQE